MLYSSARAEKVLSSPGHDLTAQGTALQCLEPSVIPLSYPGTPYKDVVLHKALLTFLSRSH